MTDGNGVEAVFEASGSQAGFSQAPELCCPNGRIVTVATYAKPMQITTSALHFKQLELVTTRAYQKEDFDEALDLMEKKLFDCGDLISKVMPLEKLEEAIEASTAGADVVKVIVDCQSVQ
jgi:threonine dehydrogenase-like Zn-dependent dehydrogenase